MAVTGPPPFHHRDAGTPEPAWQRVLRGEGRPHLDLDAVHHLVVVAAHPDDETLMAGGLLATAHRRGIVVDVIVATDGEGSHPHSPTHRPSDLVALRRDEVGAALPALAPGARLHTPGLPDGALAGHNDQLVRMIVDLVGTGGRDTLLVSTWHGDGHTDHEALALAAASAAWRTDAHLLEAPIWLWHWGSPTDPLPPGPALRLSREARHAKRAAMAAHRSQVAALSALPGDEAILTPGMLSHFERDVEIFFRGIAREENPFEPLHAHHSDPWSVRSSFYEARKRALTMAALPRRSYRRILELGCSVGALTADLASRAEEVLAVDGSASALRLAGQALSHLTNVRLARRQVPEELGLITADLVVISEIGYFLSPERMRTLAEQVAASGCPTVLACHWRHDIEGWPLDGPAVHEILRTTLAMPEVVSLSDPDFVLSVFSLGDVSGG